MYVRGSHDQNQDQERRGFGSNFVLGRGRTEWVRLETVETNEIEEF